MYVRLIPMTWRNGIAVRLALLGCPVTSTTLGHELLHSTAKPTIKRDYIFSICIIQAEVILTE